MENEYTIKFLASPVQEVVKKFTCSAKDYFNAGMLFQQHINESKLSEVEILDIDIFEFEFYNNEVSRKITTEE
jgi:hypothetical protein